MLQIKAAFRRLRLSWRGSLAPAKRHCQARRVRPNQSPPRAVPLLAQAQLQQPRRQEAVEATRHGRMRMRMKTTIARAMRGAWRKIQL